MTEIVDYMQAQGKITDTQLEQLIADYRSYDRWQLPGFAACD